MSRRKLYASEWLEIYHDDAMPDGVSVTVEFTTGFNHLRLGVGDAHELGQALYHVGAQILSERHGHAPPPMPGFDAPSPLEER